MASSSSTGRLLTISPCVALAAWNAGTTEAAKASGLRTTESGT